MASSSASLQPRDRGGWEPTLAAWMRTGLSAKKKKGRGESLASNTVLGNERFILGLVEELQIVHHSAMGKQIETV